MRIAASMVLCLVCSSAFGAQLFWGGGSGNWDTSTANWGASAAGPFTSTWTNGNDAVFGGAGAPVTITAAPGISTNSILFTSSNYTLAGNPITLGAGGIDVAPTFTATVNAALTGTNGLTKTGTGTLALTGTNTYSGATNVNAGTLRVGTPPAGLRDGLVMHMAYEDTLIDATGNGHRGEVWTSNTGLSPIPPAYATGKFGKAAQYLTNNRNVVVPFSQDLFLHNYTVSGWVNLAAAAGSLLGTRYNQAGTFDIQITASGLHGDCGPGGGGGNFFLPNPDITNTALVSPLNAWHLITYVVDSNARHVTIYCDGGPGVGTAGAVLTAPPGAWTNFSVPPYNKAIFMQPAGSMTIGSARGNDVSLMGLADELCIYNRLLSAAEVTQLYNTGVGALPNNVIPDASAVTISGGATLDLNSSSETIGALSGAGNISLGTGRLVFGDSTDTVFAGVISSTTVPSPGGSPNPNYAGGITKQGSGTITLTADQTYAGTTSILAGTIQAGNGSGAGALLNTSSIMTDGVISYNLGASSLNFPNSITGNGRLVWTGTGTLNLSGVNLYKGGTTVNGGTLRLNTNADYWTISQWATGTGPMTLNGTALTGTLNTITVLASPATSSTGAIRALYTQLSNNSSLSPGGAGTAGIMNIFNTLTMDATTTANFDLNAPDGGVTNIGGDDEILSLTNVYLGGTLNINNLGSMAAGTYRLFTLTGAAAGGFSAINGPANFNYSLNFVSGGVNLIVTAAPAATLYWKGDGADNNWNTTSLNWHTADDLVSPKVAWTDNATTAAVIDGAPSITLVGARTAQSITMRGSAIVTNGGTPANTLTLGTGSVTVNAAATGTISAALVGAATNNALIKNGTGDLNLNVAATFTAGTTMVNAGKLNVGLATGVLPDALPVIVGTNGTLNLNSNPETVGGLLGNGSVTLGTATITVNNAFGTGFFGVISGAGGFTKLGAGVFVLGGANAYLGATNISAGTLRLEAGPNRLPTGTALTLGTAVVVDLNDQNQMLSNIVSVVANSSRIQDSLNNTVFPTLTLSVAGSLTFGGILGNTNANGFNLDKIGAGSLTLTAANTLTGTTRLIDGSLFLQNAGVLTTSPLSIAATKTVTLTAASAVGSLTGSGTVTMGAFQLTIGGDNSSPTFSGQTTGTGALVKNGTGTQTFATDQGYTGATTINAGGALQLGTGGGTGYLTTSAITNNASLIFNLNVVKSFGGVIGGTGSLTLNGVGGTLTLSNANTFAGGTTINAGTLIATNGTATGSTGAGTVTVNSGGTIAGTGRVAGSVTVNNGGTYSPGTSALTGGTLTTGALTLSPAAIVNLELGAPDGGVQGVGSDDEGVISAGTLTLGGTLNIIPLSGAFGSGSYRLFTHPAASPTGAFASIVSPPGATLVLDTATSGAVKLTVIAPPGPPLFWRNGPGNWETAGAWRDADDNPATWSNANNHVAIIEGPAGTISLGTAITAHTVIFRTDAHTVSGNVLTVATGNVAVSPSANVAISSVIAGLAGISKNDSGTLALSGANTYSGGTLVNGGILSVASAANVLPDASALALAAGSTLDLANNSETTASISGGGNVTLGSATLTVNQANNATYSGVISGTGSFVKSGAATLTLSGANTYAGATTVPNGMIVLSGGDDRLPVGTALALGSAATAGTLDLNNQSQTLAGLTVTGSAVCRVVDSTNDATIPTLTLNIVSGENTFSGVMGEALKNGFNVAKTGLGTLTITNTQTYTGTTNILAGMVKLGTVTGPAGPLALPGLLAYYPFDGSVHDATNTLIDGTPVVHPSGTFVPTFPIQDGRQALLLSNAAQQYINVPYNDVLRVKSYTVSGWAWMNTVPGTSFASTPPEYGLAATRSNLVDTMDLRFNRDGVQATIGYGGATGTNWINTALTVYSPASNCPWNSLSGAQRWHLLTLVVDSTPTAPALKSIKIYVDGVHTLTPGWTDQSRDALLGDRNGAGVGGPLRIGTIRGQEGWMNGYIDDLAIFSRALTAAEVAGLFTGSSSATPSLPDLSAVTIAGGATFNMNGIGDTIGSLTGAGSVTMGTGSLTFGGDNTSTSYSGVISGTGGITKLGTGQMTLTADQAYTGTTTVTAGALNCGTGGGGSIAPTTGITDSGALNFNIGSASYSPAFAIAGNGSLTWNGTGILTLAGTSVLTGGVTISAGTLAGAATMSGPLNIASGASFRPGNGAGGKFTSGATTLGSTAASFFRLKAPDNGLPNAGSDDETQVNGNITVGGTVTITDAGGIADGLYRLMTYTGTLSGAFAGVTGPAGFTYTLDVSVPGAVNLLVSQLPGQTLYWENGTGTWDTTTMNWRSVPGGAADTIWNNASNYVAVIRGTAGAITVGPALIRADNVVFQTNGFTVQSNQLSLTAGAASVSGSAVATINSVVVGNRGFTKTDTGALVLGAVNTYLGSSAVNGGTLRTAATAANDAIPNTSPMTIATGATLDLNNNNETTGALLGGGSVGLGSGTLTVNNTISSVFSGVIGGSGGLIKTGAGMQTLSGVSTYGGSTAIQNGTLQIGSTNSLPVTTAVSLGTATTNGILDLNSQNQTVAGLTAVGAQCRVVNSVATTPTFTVNIVAGENQFMGTLGNTGMNGFNLTKIGAGTLTLFAGNTYSGTTNVNAGVLKVGFSSVLQMAGLLAYYTFENNVSDVTGLGHNGTIVNVNGGPNPAQQYAAGRPGAGLAMDFLKSSMQMVSVPPTVDLDIPTFTVSGWASMNAAPGPSFSTGYAIIGTRNANSLGQSVSTYSGTIHGVISNGAAFISTSADYTTTMWQTINTWHMVTYVVDSDVVGVNAGPNRKIQIYVDGVLVQTYLAASWLGTLPARFLTPSNNFTIGAGTGRTSDGEFMNGKIDDVAVFGRALNAAEVTSLYNGGGVLGGVIPDTSPVTIAGSARLDVNGAPETIGPLSGSGDVTLGAGTLTVNSLSNATFDGVISGTGRFGKINTGTQVLGGANTYTGATNVDNGTLQLAGGANRLPAVSAVTLGSSSGNTSGILDLNNQDQTVAGLTNSGTGTNRVVDSTNDTTFPTLTVSIASGTSPMGTVLLGNTNQNGFNFAKSGNGTLTIGPNHTYTGTTQVNAGVLQFIGGAGNYLPDTTALTVANGATLSLNNLSDMSGSLSGLGFVSLGSATLTTGNDGTSTTYGGQALGTGGLAKVGPGTLTLTRDQAYTGATTIAAGTLQCGNGGAAGSIGTSGSLINNAAFIFNMSSSMTFNNIISGTGTVTGNGTGVLTLGGANTYSGGTIFNAGTLNVTNTVGSGAGTSTVIMNSGSTLGGSGTVTGVVSVNPGAAYAPGNAGGGRLTTGQLTLAAGSSSNFELNTPDGGAANTGGDDEGVVNGNFSLAGTFNGANLGGLDYGTYRLFGYTGSLVGNYPSIIMPPGFSARIDLTTPNAVNLIVNKAPVLATPDPTVAEFGNVTFQIIATDDPAETLTYALDAGAPPPSGPPPTATIVGDMVTVNVADGPAVVDVPVRVTDNGNPLLSSVQIVHVNVTNTAPTAAFDNAGSVDETSTGTVSFSGQADVSPVDVAAGFRYSYDFDNDGTFDSGGDDYANALPSATAVVPAIYFPDGPAILTVRGRIWDKDDGFTDYTTDIIVNNVDPIATLTNSGDVIEGTLSATVTFINPSDPSTADSVEFHYAFDLDNNGIFDFGGDTYLESGTNPSVVVPASFFDDGPSSVTVRARVIDKDNGFTDYFTTIDISNIAPVAFMSSIPPTDEGATTSFLMSAQLDPSQADTTAGFRYSYDFNYGGGVPSFDLGGSSYATAAFTSNPTIPAGQIQNGPATQTVLARIWDKDNGFTDYTGTFDITNVPPALSNLNVVTITENATTTLTGTITDPGVNDTFILDVDWSDGTTDSYVLSTPGTQNFSCTHQYLDDDPAGTASDIYVVSVTVTDSDGDSESQTVNAQIDNANPAVSIPNGLAPHIPEHSTIGTITLATFTDAGTLDTHRATIDWGDGQFSDSTADATVVIVEPSAGNGFVGSISSNHLYDDGPRVYTITVTVIDDDTGSGSATVNVIVDNVAPTATFQRPDAGSAKPLTSVEFINSQDVSVADQAAGFLYSYDFNNDGTFEISLSTSATATVPEAYLLSHPNHAVHGRIIDKDGGHSDYYLQQPFFASNPIFVEFDLGAQSSYTLVAAGLPAPTYSIEVVDLPDGVPDLAAIGLSFDGVATISGIPIIGGMVTLHATATNLAGSETVDLIITIKRAVNSNHPRIISAATANPNPCIAGTPVTFTVVATDDDGDVLSYFWTFADGSFARGRVVTHTYTVPGKYVVVVSVSDGKHEDTFDQFNLVVAPGAENLFDVQSAKLSFDFRKPERSTLYATGYIPIPSGPLEGVTANVSIPGSTYAQVFSFNSKGAAGDTMSLFSVKTIQTGTATSRAKFVFSLKSTNGQDPLHPSLHQMLGVLFPATTAKTGNTVPMPLVITIGSQPTQSTTVPFLYKVILNRSGKGQYKRK